MCFRPFHPSFIIKDLLLTLLELCLAIPPLSRFVCTLLTNFLNFSLQKRGCLKSRLKTLNLSKRGTQNK